MTTADGGPAARSFPDGFLWGTATAAYQIEGAVDEDGRGPSIWDTFVRTPGKMLVDATADVACDHYHRYPEDVRLMKELGATAYRFSISWPRIFPDGTGTPNPKGIDFYSRLVDQLLAAGIAPFATLYHWDLPQALQDRGGWTSRETPEAFGAYAAHVAEQLGDRVGHFFTINEFSNLVDSGYATGILAPGLQLPAQQVNQVRHHAVLGHGLAVQAIRAHGRPGIKVGPADNSNICVPVIDTPENVRAAETAMRETNAGLITVMLEGRYTDAYLEAAGADAPAFTDADLAVIGSPLDFVGVNIYQTNFYVRASDDVATHPLGYEVLPFQPSHPHFASWHHVSPESIYWGPRLIQSVWDPAEIYITENGCAATDELVDGAVADTARVMFLRSYLGELQRATAEGARVKGYFHWSVIDNFEWIAGYLNRYGLHHVDFDTQVRTPKLSAEYFRQVTRTNAVV
ncbi:beta-glucosidase [Intrasporangium oryzae NRRL B-24470]|uniref:Beta-glucosidase n=1 Tax=Intrasporangium oryzae NRRL B-24470 TaxID=1386089 RepID=W9GB96_9MICO|nr:GH1 family beta-glucosidase [Intrasporangium oryzae]EWT02088.1 beta-glucosidase [Intrasporangium oryzae NRRL B-24470]